MYAVIVSRHHMLQLTALMRPAMDLGIIVRPPREGGHAEKKRDCDLAPDILPLDVASDLVVFEKPEDCGYTQCSKPEILNPLPRDGMTPRPS